MKFYVNRILTNLDGNPLLDGPSKEKSAPVTLGFIAVEALLRDFRQDQGAGASMRMHRYNLAKKIQRSRTALAWDDKNLESKLKSLDQEFFINVATDDVALIKSRVSMETEPSGFNTLVAGAVVEAIEGEAEEAPLKEVVGTMKFQGKKGKKETTEDRACL